LSIEVLLAIAAFLMQLIGVVVMGTWVVGRIATTTGILTERIDGLRNIFESWLTSHNGLEARVRELEASNATLIALREDRRARADS